MDGSAFDRIGATAEHDAPALRVRLSDIITEYDEKRAEIVPAIEVLKSASDDLKFACSIGGEYGGKGFDEPHARAADCEKVLLRSAWAHVYAGLMIDSIAPASERDRFKTYLENPGPFTLSAIRERFGDYLLDPRYHILRGLAETFTSLDPAYKSHEKVRIGVKGLPKRIIVGYCATDYGFGGSGWERVKDAMNALQAYRGEPRLEYAETKAIHAEAMRRGEADWPGGIVKIFQNGNAHLIFDKRGLLDINRALAEFYGDVLPDAPGEEQAKRPSTEVSANLAYYPTPRAVIEAIASDVRIPASGRMLEPSCGDGRILDYMAEHHPGITCTGIEYDAGRAAEAQAKGHAVRQANFLQVEPDPRFDLIFMNPPFCGQHWRKHLDHARQFLAPDGVLICILPASANDGGDFASVREWRSSKPTWHDLPLGSFRDSGTNVCTGYAALRATT